MGSLIQNMSCTIPSPPFDLTLTMGSAPSWPFTLTDDSVDPEAAVDLTDASLWFAVKSLPTSTDAAALIFASTANGKIAITDAESGQFQVDLTESDTAATAGLYAEATFYAYVKVELASGETRVRSGWVTTLPEGIQAP